MTRFFLKNKLTLRLLYFLCPLLLAFYQKSSFENPILERIAAAQQRIYFAGKPFQNRILLTSLSLAKYRDLDVRGLFWEDPNSSMSRSNFQSEGISLDFPNEKIEGPFATFILIDNTLYVSQDTLDTGKLTNLNPADPKLQAIFLTFFHKHYTNYSQQKNRIEVSKADTLNLPNEHNFIVPFRAKGRDKDKNVPLKLPKMATSQSQESLQP